MKPAGSLDANILMRLLLDDVHEQHTAVKRLLSGASVFLVDDVAVVESVFALKNHYSFTRGQIADTLLLLLMIPQIVTDREFLRSVFGTFTTRPALSFEDCYLAAKSAKTDAAPLYTFDKKLANQLPEARLLVH